MSTPLPVCKYQIGHSALKALALFVADNHPSEPLKAVALEASGRDLFAVATNGVAIGVIRAELSRRDDPSDAPLLIPARLIGLLPAESASGSLSVESDGEIITISDGDYTVSGKGTVGRFPNWRKCLKVDKAAGASAVLNPDLLNPFADAMKTLTGSADASLIIGQASGKEWAPGYSSGPIIIRIQRYPRFLGLMMPEALKDQVPIEVLPAWAGAPKVKGVASA